MAFPLSFRSFGEKSCLKFTFQGETTLSFQRGEGVHVDKRYKCISCSGVTAPALLFPCNRCKTIWGRFTSFSDSSFCLYSHRWCRWGLRCANPPPDRLPGGLSLSQEAALMRWVCLPLLPPPREAFFLLQLWTHFRGRVVWPTGEYCSGKRRQMQSCFQRKACWWKHKALP